MSSLSTIQAQLQTDLASANAATGGSDTTIHDAITTLIGGYGSGTDDSVSSFSQLNSTLAAYLEAAEAAYTDANYASVSVVGDYATEDANYDDPAGYDLTIPAAGMIYLCNEGAPDLSWSDAVSTGTYTVRGLIPGHTYRWYTIDESGVTTANGKLLATGSLRQIYDTEDDNARDLGGSACDGGTVRYGLLYRGVYPSASSAFAATMKNVCHLKYEIDLENSGAGQYNFGGGVGYGSFPLETPDSYESLFSLESTNEYRDTLVACFNQCMENAAMGVPTYIHCSRGIDRTGLVCFFLQALLGMSGADLDIHYEASALMGTLWGGSVLNIKRTFSPWANLRDYFSGLVEDGSILDNVLYWCGRAGIQADLVNRYRAAMIDGNPATVTIANTVTNTLTGLTTSNSAASVSNGESYTATFTLASGATLTGMTVVMGGTDVTADVWDADTMTISISVVTGDIVITATASVNTHSISYTLDGVTSSDTSIYVIDGESYSTVLTVTTSGYTLSNVTVTMGGEDITADAYDESDGSITVSAVTGDLVISAEEAAPSYDVTNLIPISIDSDGSVYNDVGYMDGKYLSYGNVGTDADYFVTGFIENQFLGQNSDGFPMTLYIRGTSVTTASHCRIDFFNDSFECHQELSGTTPFSTWFDVTELSENYYQLTQTYDNGANWNGYGSQCVYLRFSLPGSGKNVIITFNEPIE
ncbi:MAG: tyrosine-protein phosphatase [Clostridiales bacterium]|nr:tyrosine-protein phosphatase [Clostridiales bacterium]